MRLACPNCEAQYEVDDALIPAEGRDVQCSACGHAWFFAPPEPPGTLRPPPPAPAAPPAPAPAPAAAAPARPAPPPAPPSAAAPAAGPVQGPAEPRRRTLDPAVAEVLREEAEREARARRAAAQPLEVQPDLGLPPAERARPAAAPSAPAPAAAPSAPAPAAAPPPRRDLLPDIEEINSTLRPDRDRPAPRRPGPEAGAAPAEAAPARGGFRLGFALMLLLALLLVALYLFAPRLAALVPAAAGPLAAWVGAVEAARGWLLGLLGGLAGAG